MGVPHHRTEAFMYSSPYGVRNKKNAYIGSLVI